MKPICRFAGHTTLLLALVSCFPWDGGGQKLDESYKLWAADRRQDMTLYRHDGEGLIEPTVFAVGLDSTHLIVKRHPNGDRTRIEYYVVERSKDSPTGSPKKAIHGPLDSLAFEQARSTLGVSPRLTFQHVERDLE